MAGKDRRPKDAMTLSRNALRSRHEIAHVEHFVATVESERSQSDWDGEVERILLEMKSPDDETRARAVREICPCRMPWAAFYRLRKAAKRLQHDPNPKVAANALHIEVDARQVAMSEGRLELMREHQETAHEESARAGSKYRRATRRPRR